MLAWCANSGRFLFHKDTSLQTDTMLKKLVAVQALPDNPMKSVMALNTNIHLYILYVGACEIYFLFRFFTAKLQFLKTCLDHGGKCVCLFNM